MGEGWYRLSELVKSHGYTRHYLLQMYNRPGQRYARKSNMLKANSPIYFHLELLKEAELKDLEMQAKSKERRMSIA